MPSSACTAFVRQRQPRADAARAVDGHQRRRCRATRSRARRATPCMPMRPSAHAALRRTTGSASPVTAASSGGAAAGLAQAADDGARPWRAPAASPSATRPTAGAAPRWPQHAEPPGERGGADPGVGGRPSRAVSALVRAGVARWCPERAPPRAGPRARTSRRAAAAASAGTASRGAQGAEEVGRVADQAGVAAARGRRTSGRGPRARQRRPLGEPPGGDLGGPRSDRDRAGPSRRSMQPPQTRRLGALDLGDDRVDRAGLLTAARMRLGAAADGRRLASAAATTTGGGGELSARRSSWSWRRLVSSA